MTEQSHAVFLSYASQDAPAAQKICEALRAAGIEVWFDQSELRGGDLWDQKIRREIHDCALFLPIVSEHTQERLEGYFRREWKLAIERMHDMAEQKAFLVPVVVDSTGDRHAVVPDLFRASQWTRLPGGETPRAFVERVQRLLSPAPLASAASAASGSVPVRPYAPPSRSTRRALPVAVGVLLFGAVAYVAIDKLWTSKRAAPTVAAPAAFAPPPHSIAVLPFADMSEKKDQEYFSDGLTEELLNSLAEINGLQVAARTSSFYFKGQHVDLGTVAHKLNVAAVLEGSVRRSEHTMRVTAQLINAVTGFHLWSKTYDRDIGDVLKLQTEIATAVAEALKVTLLGDIAQKIELGGTRNPAAFDAYLRASRAHRSVRDEQELPAVIAAYTQAIRLDPTFALALAGRSFAFADYAGEVATGAAAVRENFEKAEGDARQAIALAPDLAEGHLALGNVLSYTLDFARAHGEYKRALALAPGNAKVLRESAEFATEMGHFDAGITAARRAIVLDPLNDNSYAALGSRLRDARRYGEAVTAYAEAISLNPEYKRYYGSRGLAFYGLGDFESARTSCEAKRDHWLSRKCLAMVYDRLGHRVDSEAELEKFKAANGEAFAYEYATIYAQWGDITKALAWLDTAVRLRDAGLSNLKIDPLLDPLRNEPRFQAVMRELKFPE